MLTRFIEHVLVKGFNRLSARQRQRQPRPAALAPFTLEAGHVLLGEALFEDGRVGNGSSSLGSPPLGSPSLGHSSPPARSRSPIVLSPADRKRHLYVLGATGTGKTTLLLKLLESDLALGRSLCVLDLRGDLIDRLLPRLAATDSKPNPASTAPTSTNPTTPATSPSATNLISTEPASATRLTLLDLREEEWSLSFNPLAAEDGRHERDYHDRAYLVLAALQARAESWGVQLEETLRNCLLALAATGGTLLEIETLLCDGAFRSRVVERCEDAQVRSFFARYDALSPEKQNTWSAPVLNKITPYLSLPPLRRLFGQREALPLRRLFDREEGSVLLVSLAADRLHGAAGLVGALLLACLENAVMARARIPEAARRPLSLYVDEFENLASPRFLSLIAEGRRFGLSLCLSHQNLTQVDADLRASLRNNVHTLLLFQTGALDASELAGEVVALDTGPTQAGSNPYASALPSWQTSGGNSGNEDNTPSASLGRDEIKRLLMGQRTGETLLVRRGEPAVRVKVQPSPEPQVEAAQVQQLRECALRLRARRSHEVDALLRAGSSGYPGSASPMGTPQTRDVAGARQPVRPRRPPVMASPATTSPVAANPATSSLEDSPPTAPTQAPVPSNASHPEPTAVRGVNVKDTDDGTIPQVAVSGSVPSKSVASESIASDPIASEASPPETTSSRANPQTVIPQEVAPVYQIRHRKTPGRFQPGVSRNRVNTRGPNDPPPNSSGNSSNDLDAEEPGESAVEIFP